LILFPAMETALQATVPMEARKSKQTRLNLYFDLGFDPPVCTHGFADADKQRSPADTKPVPISPDSYCKVASDSGLVARGARNDTCPNDPSRHGAHASSCGLIFDEKATRYPTSWPTHSASETKVPLSGTGDLATSLLAGEEPFLLAPTATAHGLSDLLTRPGRRK
jgi:phospholipid/cholesterol/gamma-HCH transport system substrate-binding protein